VYSIDIAVFRTLLTVLQFEKRLNVSVGRREIRAGLWF